MEKYMVVCKKRRFTCLSPHLVRMEFSPSGEFEDRRSLVASMPKVPMPFSNIEQTDEKVVMEIGNMVITSTQNDCDFFPLNLRIDWKRDGLTETWQFGDRDYQNLGGTVRSLDYYQRDGIMNGVHPASNDSPDAYLHPEEEFWAVQQIYLQDGKAGWAVALGQQGVQGALKYAPHLVYNRNVPMAYDGLKFQSGLLSRGGYFLLNDTYGPILDKDGSPQERNTPGTRDLYFFMYGHEYKQALQDYWLLSGSAPLPDKSIFGLQLCRWPAFSDEEARAIIHQFKEQGIPLSILVLDLEWHTPDFWGWDWNNNFYPDPEGFLEWAHNQGIKVMVNVHPKYIFSSDSHFQSYVEMSRTQQKVQAVPSQFYAMGLVKSDARECVEINLADKAEAHAYQKVCLEPLLGQGVDFLWLDMNSARLNGADGQILSSKVFFEASEKKNLRGRLQSRYGGLGSHRYGVFFTGDTASQWEVLRSECEFTIRAGQAGMAYVSHDIGGFSHEPAPLIDPNLYIRWVQFGVFSPVFRFHSAPDAGSRQPWDYGERNLLIAKHWLELRQSLQPYIYTTAYQHFLTGKPIVRGLYLEHPEKESSYRWDEFYFGDSLLVAPILNESNHRQVYLPEGLWYKFETSDRLQGGKEFFIHAGLDQVPVYVKAGSILIRDEGIEKIQEPFCRHLLLDIYPGADGEALLYEDDGETLMYKQGEYNINRFSLVDQGQTIRLYGESESCFHPVPGRTINFLIHVQSMPETITINGSALDVSRYTYDVKNESVLIQPEPVLLLQRWEICLLFHERQN